MLPWWGASVCGRGMFEEHARLLSPSELFWQRVSLDGLPEQLCLTARVSCTDLVPRAYIGALAAGEKVLASTQSAVYTQLKSIYGDALAIEMERHGFLQAM